MSLDEIQFQVDDPSAGVRLDKFLVAHMANFSRHQILMLIRNQRIRVNAQPAKASYRVRSGDAIQVTFSPRASSELKPEAIPLKIHYEDDQVAVIEKPAGLVMHTGAGVDRGTLVNALLYHFRDLSSATEPFRPGLVHRLDKNTSGLLVIAKTDEAHRHLAEQFQARAVEKKYLALVHGPVQKDRGEIVAPIGRDRVRRTRMTTRSRWGREAISIYRVLQRFERFTLLEVEIKTGRTHQIRVHLSSIGHPVAGDTQYGAPARAFIDAEEKRPIYFPRLFLHAASLKFTHPLTQRPLQFSSELPAVLQSLLEQLQLG